MDLNKILLNKILIEAAKNGNMLVVKICIEKGADVNAKDEYGWTALMYAKERGYTEIMNFLKEKGAMEFEAPEKVLKEKGTMEFETPKNEELFPVIMGYKCGYIDKTGRIVIEPQFDDAWYFSEGLAPVGIGMKCGYIDKTGRYV